MILDAIVKLITSLFTAGKVPAVKPVSSVSGGLPLKDKIATVERKYGIPAGLLYRLLEIESIYFNADVLAGKRLSPTGAKGIAQVLSSTARDPGYGIKPLWGALGDRRDDVDASIEFAAQYLTAMRKNVSDWRKACAAYNQGLGNVLNATKISPTNWLAHIADEGKKYVKNIPDYLGVK